MNDVVDDAKQPKVLSLSVPENVATICKRFRHHPRDGIMKALERLVRNRCTEKDVRDYLQDNGFQGPSARFDYLELKAIERPGWVQVFQFSVHVVDDEGQPRQFLGVARDDERKGMDVFLTTSEVEQVKVTSDWSAGLITASRERSKLTPLFLAIFGLILLIAVASAMLSG